MLFSICHALNWPLIFVYCSTSFAFQSNFATMDENTGIVTSRRADRHFEEEGPILCAALDGMKLPSFPEYEVRVRYRSYNGSVFNWKKELYFSLYEVWATNQLLMDIPIVWFPEFLHIVFSVLQYKTNFSVFVVFLELSLTGDIIRSWWGYTMHVWVLGLYMWAPQ